MAEAIVPSLLKLIPDLVKLSREEWDLASTAKAELGYLQALIGAIGRFLEKANSKEVIDMDLKASMKQMRKFLYDSADAIDDFMERGNRKWEGLGPYICGLFNLQTVAFEAEEIRRMMKNYDDAMKILNGLYTDLGKPSSACQQSEYIAFVDEKDNDLVGIETATGQLSQLLTESSSTRKVIFVHGMQGVGKTSLVGAVLRNKAVRRHFKYYVWVKDLRSCELADDKAAALLKTNVVMWDPTEKKTHYELQQIFERFQSKNVRWVLVLDDAGCKLVFDSLQQHLAQTRPTMLVTTRNSRLAFDSTASLDSRMAPSSDAPSEPAKILYDSFHFKHVFLSQKDSVELLRQKTSGIDFSGADLPDACGSMQRQCEGLPLAILAVSELLSGISHGVTGNSSYYENYQLSCKLGEELFSKGHTRSVGPIKRMVTLRLDHLYDVLGCLLYLSIFPLGRHISCSTLMRLWMAERFSEQKGTRPGPKIAEEALEKLVDHNFFLEVEKTSYGRVKTCRIHNILHQIIISKSKDDEFVMIVVDPEEAWPETVWRLSFHCKMVSIKDITKVKRLRSLLVFESLYPDCMEELLKQVSRLKVLDIQESSLNKFPKEILDLKFLRYLSLKGTNVTKIPDGIEGLQHLETLNLKGTNVTELPESILKLQFLRHLLVYRSNGSPDASNHTKIIGVKAPARLGDLKSLLKLCLIDLHKVKRGVGQIMKETIQQLTGSNLSHGNRLLEELGKLEDLRRLGISNLEREHVNHLRSLIKKLKKLESLHLIASARCEGSLNLEVDEIQASPCLQRVHLTGYMVSLPTWILSQSLVKLVLKGSKLNVNDPLQHFKKLPSLKHLELQQAFYGVREMVFEEGGFQELRFLGLDTFDSLESITVAERALPALEKLFLARCEKLTRVQGITYPKQLKRLELYQTPAFVSAVRRDDAVVGAHIIPLEKLWIDGAVVGGDPTDDPKDRPESSRRSIATMK